MIKESERHSPAVLASPPNGIPEAVDIVVGTPKGGRARFTFEPRHQRFRLDEVLPAGAVFPYGLGFFPGTEGEAGGPLEALLLTDEVAFPGCLIPSRLIGIWETEATESDGSIGRRDLVLAVAAVDPAFRRVHSPMELEPAIVQSLTHFFAAYHEARGARFRPLGMRPADTAYALVDNRRKKGKNGGRRGHAGARKVA